MALQLTPAPAPTPRTHDAVPSAKAAEAPKPVDAVPSPKTAKTPKKHNPTRAKKRPIRLTKNDHKLAIDLARMRYLTRPQIIKHIRRSSGDRLVQLEHHGFLKSERIPHGPKIWQPTALSLDYYGIDHLAPNPKWQPSVGSFLHTMQAAEMVFKLQNSGNRIITEYEIQAAMNYGKNGTKHIELATHSWQTPANLDPLSWVIVDEQRPKIMKRKDGIERPTRHRIPDLIELRPGQAPLIHEIELSVKNDSAMLEVILDYTSEQALQKWAGITYWTSTKEVETTVHRAIKKAYARRGWGEYGNTSEDFIHIKRLPNDAPEENPYL